MNPLYVGIDVSSKSLAIVDDMDSKTGMIKFREEQ